MANIVRYLNFSSGELIPISTEIEEEYITEDTDLESLNFQIANNYVSSQFRIYVLYPDDTINYEIKKENIKLGGVYSENYQNGQRKTLSFSLYNDFNENTPNINQLWEGTRLRLDIGVKLIDNRIIWVTKGYFVITSVSYSKKTDGKVTNIEAGDKFMIFDGALGRIETSYEIPVGEDIEQVIRSILLMPTGDSNVYDSKEILYHSSLKGKLTQSTITKEAGDTLGSILLDLATQLSAEIFYNSNGNLTIIPINEVTNDIDKNLLYDYDTKDGTISDLNFQFDYSSVVNKVIVIGNSSDGGVYKGISVNDDPSSPLCYQRIGYRIGEIINDSNIYSNILAQERADYELRQKLIIKTSTSAEVLFNPFLEVNNIITVTDESYHLVKDRFLIQSLSYNLDNSNQTTVSFTNINNLSNLT